MEHVLLPLDAKEREQAFDALPLEKQRVILAQEVVLLVQTGRILPEFQVYIRPLYEYGEGGWQLQETLIEKADIPVCKACVLGALVCSLAYIKGGIPYTRMPADVIQEILSRYFTPEELGVIECAFEGLPMQTGAGYIYFKRQELLTESEREYKHRLFNTVKWNNYLRNTTTTKKSNYAEYVLLTVVNKIIADEGKVQF